MSESCDFSLNKIDEENIIVKSPSVLIQIDEVAEPLNANDNLTEHTQKIEMVKRHSGSGMADLCRAKKRSENCKHARTKASTITIHEKTPSIF
jgi:hypothetical protein